MAIAETLSFILKREDELVEDAFQYVVLAAQHTILHGNMRNFRDALDQLATLGAITKKGRIAFNRKGATYRALQEAMDSSKKEREEFITLYSQHREAPTEMMKANAKSRASAIAAKFKETYIAKN